MRRKSYRSLTSEEARLLERLLEEDFPGRDALSRQIENSLVRRIDPDGCLEFQVLTDQQADVKCSVPTEGWAQDADGVMIRVLLHVVNGKVDELEIYKDDGSRVIRMPNPSDLSLFQPIERGRPGDNV